MTITTNSLHSLSRQIVLLKQIIGVPSNNRFTPRLTVVAIRINGFHLNWIRIGHDQHEDQIIRFLDRSTTRPTKNSLVKEDVAAHHPFWQHMVHTSIYVLGPRFEYKLSAKWLALEMVEIVEKECIPPFVAIIRLFAIKRKMVRDYNSI